MSTYGFISEFKGQAQDWSSYVDRVNCYFDANDITNVTKQRNIFLSVVGEEIYYLLRGLLSPKTPREETLDGIIKSLNKHFVTETNTIV